MKDKAVNTAGKSARPKPKGRAKGRELIPQPHGGALLSGGQIGQTPGPGRTPNHVRQLAVEIGYTEAIPKLRALLNDKDSDPRTVVSAAKEILALIPRKDENVLTTATVEQLCRTWAECALASIQRHAPEQRAIIESEIMQELARLSQSITEVVR